MSRSTNGRRSSRRTTRSQQDQRRLAILYMNKLPAPPASPAQAPVQASSR